MKPVGTPMTPRPLPTQDPCATLQSILPASLVMRLLWMEQMTSSKPLLIMASEEVPAGPLPCGLKHRPQISPSSSTEPLVLPRSINYLSIPQVQQCLTLGVQAMPSPSSTTGLADGNWHHLVATLPAGGTIGDARLYIDGTSNQVTNTTSVNTSTSANLIIGTDGPSGSSFFNGQIDDVRFYEAELNSTLVSQLYGNGNGDFNRLKINAAGTVTLTANQPGNGSYAPAPSVTLSATFNKSDQTISFGAIAQKSVGDFNFIPNAVASSGLDLTFTSSNENVAKVLTDNRTIQIRAAGTATITASQAGDDAYNAATSVKQSLSVGYFNLQDDSLPGIRLWLDANNMDGDDTEDTGLSNGLDISGSWIDRSGNNNHASQSHLWESTDLREQQD